MLIGIIANKRHNGGRLADSGVLTGSQWHYYVSCEQYWRVWVGLNKN